MVELLPNYHLVLVVGDVDLYGLRDVIKYDVLNPMSVTNHRLPDDVVHSPAFIVGTY